METDEKSRNNGTLQRRPAGWKWIFSVWGVAIIALMWQVSVRISPVAAEQPLAAAPAASALPLWANLHSEPARPAAFAAPATPDAVELQAGPRYILLAWNDLGMHCYNPDYADIGVLPPFNTLWAQVVRVGDPPTVITAGVTLSYEFVDNSYSVGKTNFWNYADKLFGVSLAPNVGLTGKGLTGTMDMAGDHFIAAGIPLTEYNDSAPTTPNPFQLAVIVARDSVSGAELARTTTVAPISSEMRCDNCHSDTGDATTRYPITPTGKIETNILALHDYLSASRYPPGHTGRLMDPARRPVLCAECHSSNALNAPGVAGISSLSNAMHNHHQDLPDITLDRDGCYNCHPGPNTQCLRDIMSRRGVDCVRCHGIMHRVAINPQPWLSEPRCDAPQCHGSGYAQDQALFRFSKEHGGIYCEGCHDSTHAVAPSREPNDAIKFLAWQGHAGTLDSCTVCHLSQPAGAGPHGITQPVRRNFSLQGGGFRVAQPGAQAVHTLTLLNIGNGTDSYDIASQSEYGWSSVSVTVDGEASTSPVTLTPNQQALISISVGVPSDDAVRGLCEHTVVTVTSQMAPALPQGTLSALTMVPWSRFMLPLVTMR